jgi:hypothetical protein
MTTAPSHAAADGAFEPTLDHLVLATPHLRETVDDVAARCGVRPVEGGRHVGLGTRNHLIGLGGNAYLEIIGPDDEQPAPPQPRPFGVDALTGPRLVTWAVRPDDVDAVVARARAAGHDPGDPRPMSRRTPSGDLLAWRLTPPSDGGAASAHGLWPFLIDWGATPHPTAAPHPTATIGAAALPVVPLLSLRATHPDPDAVYEGLAALGVRLEVTRGERPALVAVLGTPGGRLTLT